MVSNYIYFNQFLSHPQNPITQSMSVKFCMTLHVFINYAKLCSFLADSKHIISKSKTIQYISKTHIHIKCCCIGGLFLSIVRSSATLSISFQSQLNWAPLLYSNGYVLPAAHPQQSRTFHVIFPSASLLRSLKPPSYVTTGLFLPGKISQICT